VLYMGATRTQVYLTGRQREELDRLSAELHLPMAHLIRDAVDIYIEARKTPDLAAALEQTFGIMPNLEVPSRDEWDVARPAD
jgi:hypothetical protein